VGMNFPGAAVIRGFCQRLTCIKRAHAQAF